MIPFSFQPGITFRTIELLRSLNLIYNSLFQMVLLSYNHFHDASITVIMHAMKTKTLSAANRFLKGATSGQWVARNLASSTSVETGKPSQIYVTRYQDSRLEKTTPGKTSKSRQKAAS